MLKQIARSAIEDIRNLIIYTNQLLQMKVTNRENAMKAIADWEHEITLIRRRFNVYDS